MAKSNIPTTTSRIRNVASTSDPSNGIEEATYTGLPDGMAPAIPAHELPDTMCRMLVDGFVHNPGLIVRRGPVTALPGIANLPYPPCGFATVVDPTGISKVGALHGDASHGYLGVWSTDFTSRVDLALGINLPQTPYQLVQTAPRLFGGVYITIQAGLTQGAAQYLLQWNGSGAAAYSTGTVTCTQGSTAVTGSGTAWLSNVQPGAFLFAAGVYVGVVKSISADGALTLDANALVSASGVSYSAQPFRGINPRVGKGYITTSTVSAVVNGANTKFQADGLGTGTWDIYRSSDFTFIGTVTSVTSDIQFTLTANATLNLSQEPYVAINRNGSYGSSPSIGVITTQWGARQAFANNSASMTNTSKVWFSSVDDAEAIDEATTDGDFIQVPSVGPAGTATPIVAMVPTPSSLLILKENEAYGLFGQTTAQFQTVPVSTDGCLSAMSVQTWNGLAVYAGKQGIYMYDGQEAVNVTQERLGWYYQTALGGFDSTKHRMWSMIDRDHYLLFIESVTPPVPILHGSQTVTQTAFTIAVHLPSGAITLLSNLNIRGSLQLPANLGHATWYLVNNAVNNGVLCSADALFDSIGNDDFGCDGGTAGPAFYLETKKYTMGDSLLKKLWKMILLTYVVAGDNLVLDTVPGLNEIGTTSNTQFVATGQSWADIAAQGILWGGDLSLYPTWDAPVDSQFVTNRVRFLKRAQMMSFRLYQNSSSVKALILGPWSLVAKPQRIGRT